MIGRGPQVSGNVSGRSGPTRSSRDGAARAIAAAVCIRCRTTRLSEPFTSISPHGRCGCTRVARVYAQFLPPRIQNLLEKRVLCAPVDKQN